MSVRPTIPTPPTPTRLAMSAFLGFVLLVVSATGCGGTNNEEGRRSTADTELAPLAGGPSEPLSALQGKPVVVNLWAPWCTPCVREMPEFDEVHRRLGSQVTIVGITDGLDRAEAQRFAEKTGVSYPLLVDDAGNLQTDLGVVNLPTTVFLDADGKVVGRHAGAFTAETLTAKIESVYDID